MLKKVSVVLLAIFSLPLQARVDDQQAARLDQDLTPMGAERAGNAAGTIPAWTGGITVPPKAYRVGMHHPDPYAGDHELYRVDASSIAKYEALLTPGYQRLLADNPDYYLRVFPTHRSASVPQRIYDATRQNATSAELISGGNGIQGASAGVAFPIPKDGQEAIWNHVTRYHGDQIQMVTLQSASLPNGQHQTNKRVTEMLAVYGHEGTTQANLENTLFYYKYLVTEPSKNSGDAMVVQETIDQILAIRKVWRFTREDRRVRRMPELAYDAIQPDTQGMLTADMVDSYNGAPEHYQWTLQGKREMLVPYNSYAVHQQGIPYSKILLPKTVNPELLRYELHRVWVVEADLRVGFSHPYAKRRFYMDEDSWQILAVDLYDSAGKLMGMQEAHPINYYDVPVFANTLETIYRFDTGLYFAGGLDNNEPMYDFNVSLGKVDFGASALRRVGK